MAAWGATGVLGAAAGVGDAEAPRHRAHARAMGRWPLAIVCCAAGFAFTVVQDVGDWVSFSDHSLAPARGLRRTGPGLRRGARRRAAWPSRSPSGRRSRARSSASRGGSRSPGCRRSGWWRRCWWRALAVGAWALARARTAARAAVTSPASLTSAAANYLLGSENADGGFGAAPGQPSDQLYAGWAALGLASAGHDLNSARGRAGPAWTTSAQVRATRRRRRAGADDPRRPRRRAVGAVVRRPRPDRGAAAPLPGRRLDLGPGQPHRVRGAGAARRRGHGRERQDAAVAACASRTPTVASASPGAGGSSDIDDTGATLEALAGDHGRGACDVAGGGLPAPPAGPRRRLSLPARDGLQRPVDGVGDAGPRGRRRVAGHPAPRRRGLAAGLPRLAGGGQRRRALQPGRHPDTGVGDRRGADGDGGQAAADRRSGAAARARRSRRRAATPPPAPRRARPPPPAATATGARSVRLRTQRPIGTAPGAAPVITAQRNSQKSGA